MNRGFPVLAVLFLTISSGCILSGEQQREVEVVDDTDEFIKEYLAEREEMESLKEKQETVEPAGSTTTSQTSTSTIQDKPPCPYECCSGRHYLVKQCGRWFRCFENECVERTCPYECCVLGMYEEKRCKENIDCLNYSCVKRPCPSEIECCSGQTYQAKACRGNYTCYQNRCYSKDTDRDLLVDVIELRIGSSIKDNDTDGDGVSDYVEYKILGSDPLSKNTDADRYGDADDANPTKADTARLNVTYSDFGLDYNRSLLEKILHYLDFDKDEPANDTLLAEIGYNVRVANTGSDYTKGFNYTTEYFIWCQPGVYVERKPFVIDQYDENATENETRVAYVHHRLLPENTTEPTTYGIKKWLTVSDIRLEPGERYITHVSERIVYGDLENRSIPAVVAYRGCTHNISGSDIGYDRFWGV